MLVTFTLKNQVSHSIDGYRFLLGLSLDIKKRIRIGYHYPYTEKIIRLKDLVNAHSGDDFLSIVLKIGKPLKDFPWFQDDWRNENDFVVSHTLLSHLISVYAFLIGSPAFYPDKISVILNQYPNANATAFAHRHCLNHMFFAVASWDSLLLNWMLKLLLVIILLAYVMHYFLLDLVVPIILTVA